MIRSEVMTENLYGGWVRTWCSTVSGYPPYVIKCNEVQCVLLPTRVRESKPRCRTTLFTLFSMCRTSELIFMLWSPSRTVRRATSHELMLQHSRPHVTCHSFGCLTSNMFKEYTFFSINCTFCPLLLAQHYIHDRETKEVRRKICMFLQCLLLRLPSFEGACFLILKLEAADLP